MNKLVSALESRLMSLGAGASPAWHRLSDRPIVRIHLLGPMRATTCLGDNILPHGRRARALLGYLCLTPEGRAPRADLATLLWDRVSEAAARTNLRQVLHEISSAFGVFANELISTPGDFIRLSVDACWIDALATMTLDPSALDSPDGGLMAICRGELLENLDRTSASFYRWLLSERIRVAEQVQLLLERGMEQATPRKRRGLTRALAEVRGRVETLRDIERRRNGQENSGAETLPKSQEPSEADDVSRPFKQPIAHDRDRLRVGVLPFVASGSERDKGLAFSLSQEVAAALARFRWFDVIAPVSLRRLLSEGFVAHQKRHEDDLDYVVDGAISAAGTSAQLHVNVRLLDLIDYARPVWTQTFDLARGELHRLNELVTTPLVARIDPVILHIEGQPRRRERYGATGLLLLAMPMIFSMERRKYEEAGKLIERALELEPDNTMVEAWAAYWHLFYAGQGWAKDSAERFEEVHKHALRAIELDPDNAEALGIYAHVRAYAHRDFDTAIRCFDRSLRLNPSLAFIWGLSSMTYCYIGHPDAGLERLERYRDLAPFDPYYSWFESFYTVAYWFKGDYERAVIFGQRATKATPDFVAGYKPLIASLGQLGRVDEAKPYIAKLLTLEPGFTVERFGEVYPFKRASDRRRYMRGLRLAGVPER